MGFRVGSGYFGSDDIETTAKENEEVLQKYLPTVTRGDITRYKPAYKLTFKPIYDCHIKINGGDSMFLEAETAFSIDMHDLPINSIVVVEDKMDFLLYGAY